MLTVDFKRLGIKAGDLVLDMGAGAGRHAFEDGDIGRSIIACFISSGSGKGNFVVGVLN